MHPRSGLAVRLVAITTVAVAAAMPAPAAAQEVMTPVPGAFCTLITDEEASAAFGMELVLTGISGRSCTWSPPGDFGSQASLVPALFPGTLAEQQEYYADFPGGIQEITVGGQPGLLRVSEDFWRSGMIFTDALGEVLEISWNDYEGLAPDVDIEAALTQLTEAALPRMSAITFAEPTPQPMPSFRSDAELVAMFPTTIAGQPVQAGTFMFTDLIASFPSDPDNQATIDRLTETLAAQGRTLDDVSIGQAYISLPDGLASIVAARVRGGDAKALVDAMGPLMASSLESPQLAPGQVAGRDVTIATGADGAKMYFLASGDVLWQVSAEEPVLSEIISLLP
jgi:hypothetical protein